MVRGLIPIYVRYEMAKRNKLITEFIKVFTRPQTRNPHGHSLQLSEMLAGDSVQLHDCMLHISLHPAIFRRPAALAWARGAAVLHTVCSVPVPRDLQIPALPPLPHYCRGFSRYQEIHFWYQIKPYQLPQLSHLAGFAFA